ncbi:hypothetical protein AB0L59_26565 [Streptomyces sp. NPDC052109]|uniref:hypothetical protein n=1 Tax=Streptomyces sp. NPDC052109 TaxID=3155527 RepID=UPI003431363F
MSQQYPQQPGWQGQPQQPQQPQWGAPTQPGWGAPPPLPPKKRSAGKIVGLGCLGIVGLFVIIGIIAAAAGSGGSKKNDSSGSTNTASATHNTSKSSGNAKTSGSDSNKAPSTVTFKVWGTAPAGALGGLDISYGSDSDTRKGTFKDGKFTATLPFKKKAMYYQVNAQLQGSGDIHCSVTVDGHTKTAHASGGYNICDTQLSSFTGDDWN